MRKINLRKIKPGDGVTSQRFGTGKVWKVWDRSMTVLFSNTSGTRFVGYNQYGEQCDGTYVGMYNGDVITVDEKFYTTGIQWKPVFSIIFEKSAIIFFLCGVCAIALLIPPGKYNWIAVLGMCASFVTFVISLFVLIKLDK